MADSGAVITYGMLEEQSNRTAQLFRRYGLQAGDAIVVFMENHPTYMEIMWGAQRSGIIASCISSTLLVDEVQYMVFDSGCKIFFTSRALLPVAKDVAELHANRKIKWFLVDGKDGHFDNYLEERARCPDERIKDEILGGTMLYTSGSTGRPKGVKRVPPKAPPGIDAQLLTRFDNEHPAVALGRSFFGWEENSVYLSPAPLYHAAPLNYNLAIGSLGATSIIMKTFDPEFALECIQKYKCTTGLFVPTHFVKWLKLPEQVRSLYDLTSINLIFHAAAPCPIPVKEAMIQWFGPRIMEFYAGTEGNGFTIISSAEWLRKKGSVGRVPIPGVEIKICDETGNVLAPKQDGLVYFSGGDQFEYHGDMKKTLESRHPKNPLWSTLGDIGCIDEEGYLFLTDRQSFMIISGGVNIYPQSVHSKLIVHPKVQDAAVIGVPDEVMGERVVAVVQPLDWSSASQDLANELTAYLRQRMSHIKVPKTIEFLRQLPRHDTGKLFKRLIRDAYWGKGSTEYLGTIPKRSML
ncbi:AMP-dependent synthetase and ligase [Gonapodya prolifera JEL478]|uniref:AMP-dependent synthetase and ligase n=1 Tax=Gonapodya prolifera (strain JEL478) TaxID=1344416 RepID=A0A139A075_GONPJ|nr:AMP-dependent synthetase and ligase [Gonapodya prolifera JEL478]|eukprot:KXS10186.1 AMP-dependent synthetase and ligase [Gonapodya prolifera JEL478]